MVKKLENKRISFRECVETLKISLLPYQEAKNISLLFEKMCPLTSCKKIDWDRFDKKIIIHHEPKDIIPTLEELSKEKINSAMYIKWSDDCLPVIGTNLHDIIKNFNVVVGVAFEKFIFNPTTGYVVEIDSDGKIIAGIFPITDKFLKEENFIDYSILQNNVVFTECIKTLKVNLLPEEEEKSLDNWFKKHVPMTKWGRIDWENFDRKMSMGYDPQQILWILNLFLEIKGPFDKTTYIEWGEVGIPVIKTNLDDIIGNFEKIAPIAFEKFLFNPSLGYVIEVLHSNQMTVGIVPTQT